MHIDRMNKILSGTVFDNAEITLFTLNGRTVFKNTFKKGTCFVPITFARGQYAVKVTTQGFTTLEKVLIK
jgi:hypothetical protein